MVTQLFDQRLKGGGEFPGRMRTLNPESSDPPFVLKDVKDLLGALDCPRNLLRFEQYWHLLLPQLLEFVLIPSTPFLEPI